MILWSVVGATVSLALSATFSGMETGVYSLERVRLRVRAAAGDRIAERLLGLANNPLRAMCTILVVNNAVNYCVAAFCGDIVKAMADPDTSDVQLELINTLWVVPVLFIFGEVVPKQLFLMHPAALSARAWPVYRVLSLLLLPVIIPLMALQNRLARSGPAMPPLLARKGIINALTEGDESETLHRTQRWMASRVLALRDVTVRERMVAAADVVCVEPRSTRDDVLRVASGSGRSRLLVRDPSEGVYRGYVNAMDAAFADPGERWRLEGAVFDIPSVEASTPVLEAVRLLQQARRPLAQVVESGRAVGILGQADVVDVLVAPSAAAAAKGRKGQQPNDL